MMTRVLTIADLTALQELTLLADAEGFRFMQRFVDDLTAGRIHLDAMCEFFLGAMTAGQLVALGGVTPDPYAQDPRIGRLRHVYVRRDVRGTGIGRTLVAHLEVRARTSFALLRLRTDTAAAANFYEHLGYDAIASSSATHERELGIAAACPGARSDF